MTVITAIHPRETKMATIGNMNLSDCRSVGGQVGPEPDTVKNGSRTIGQGDTAIIIAGLLRRLEGIGLDEANAQVLRAQCTGQRATDEATADDQDIVIRSHG